MPKHYRNRWARTARDAGADGEPTAGGGGKSAEDASEDGGAETGGNDDAAKDVKQHSEASFTAIKAEKQRAIDERDALAAKVKQFEDAQLSKEDKLTKDHAEATDKAAKAELRALKLEVGLEMGLSVKQALRLDGTTKEELKADADDLRETFSTAADRIKKKPEGLRGGGAPDEDDGELDPAKLAEKVRANSGRMYAR